MSRLFVRLGFLSLFLSACEFSLAGDITPPPEAIIAGEATVAPVSAPASPPDLSAGAETYANRCAPCHGVIGLGDGEQAGLLPFFPSAIGDPNLARTASPEDWFRIVSLGRLTRSMPPFASALSEQERWNVLAYVYSLGWDSETLSKGERIYDQNKAEIDNLLSGFSPIAIELSSIEALQLPVEIAQSLTAYLQAKALGTDSPAETSSEISTVPAIEESAVLGRFIGNVVYGSGDQSPSGLEARLYGFDHTDQVVSEVVLVSSEGSFAFDEIPLVDGRIFFVQVDFNELSFFSEFVTVEGQQGTYDLDVPIFDSTSDISLLAAERLQFFFDFPRAGVIRVVESVTISNLGDKAVAPDENGNPVLHFTLPEQASNLMFQEGELGDRYVSEGNGFGDTRAVIPGIRSVEMYFAYELPYNGRMEFPIHFDLATKTIVVLLPLDFEVQGDNLTSQGQEDVDGVSYLVYSGDAGYSQDEDMTVQFSGVHPLGGTGLFQDDSLLIGLIALTMAVGFAWFWLRRLPVAESSNTNLYLAQIASLDGRYERGKITKTNYSKKRTALKELLRKELGK